MIKIDTKASKKTTITLSQVNTHGERIKYEYCSDNMKNLRVK